MKYSKVLYSLLIATFAMSGLSVSAKSDKAAMRVANAIWAHDEIYDTIVTPSSFKSPPVHSTDVIYNFSMSGLDGQRGVSEVAPGDRGFNGGRWWVHFVVFTEQGLEIHDADQDGFVDFELTNAEDVLYHESLGHLTIMSSEVYFVCPVLKSRN